MDDITRMPGRYNAPAMVKTCSRCGAMKPVEEFTRGRSDCKDCAAALFVFCGCGCGRRKERDMLIYSVRQDPKGYPGKGTYYVSQLHKDKADGVKRDSKGFIVQPEYEVPPEYELANRTKSKIRTEPD